MNVSVILDVAIHQLMLMVNWTSKNWKQTSPKFLTIIYPLHHFMKMWQILWIAKIKIIAPLTKVNLIWVNFHLPCADG